MGTIGKRILAVAIGLLLAAAAPHLPVTNAVADPGCGQGCGHHEGCGQGCPHHDGFKGCTGCECGCPKGGGQAVPPCMQDNAAAVPGGMHRMMHGGGCGCGGHQGKHEGMHGGGAPPMKEGMARHTEEMRGTIAKLRALEAKMEALKAKDDAAAFRAASLDHSKLLTDLEESRLKHMERMMGGK